MSNVEIIADTASVAKGTEVEVTTSETKTSHTLDTTRIAEVSTNAYVLSSGGIYGSGYSGGVPGWLKSAIDEGIFAGINSDSTMQNLEDALRNLLDSAVNGVYQTVVDSQTAETDLSAMVTQLASTIDQNYSKIGDVEATYATKTETGAAVIEALTSVFGEGGPEAWAQTVTSTFASQLNAISQDVTTISSAMPSVQANAEAVQTLRTEVGITDTGALTGIGLLADVASLQGQIDGTVVTWFELDSPIDDTTRAPLAIEKPYALWLPIISTDAPTITGDEEEQRCYVQTLNDVAINWYQFISGVWVSITEEEYATAQYALRSLHTGDTYVEYALSQSSQTHCESVGGTWTGTCSISEHTNQTDCENASGTWSETCDIIGQKVYLNSYRFAQSTVDDDTDAGGFGWFRITDSIAADALSKALAAQDTADGKRAVFITKPVENGVYTQKIAPGDLWILENDTVYDGYVKGDLLVSTYPRNEGETYFDNHWEIATRYAADIDSVSDGLVEAVNNITDLKSIQDGEIVIYYNEKALDDFDPETGTDDLGGLGTINDPEENLDFGSVGEAVTVYINNGSIYSEELQYGDYWLDVDAEIDANGYYPVYMWNDVEWTISYNAVAKGISDTYRAKLYSNDIFSIADGKMVVFYQDEEPNNADIGDLWVDTDDLNITYIWDGNSWADTNNRVANDAFDIAQAVTENLAIEAAKLAGLEETNDGVIVTFYTSDGEPTAMSYGDWLVHNTDSNGDAIDYPTQVDRYEDSNGKNVDTLSWVSKPNSLFAKSLVQAYDAKNVADGKTVVYYKTLAEISGISTSTFDTGDMWVNTADGVTKVWNGDWQDTSNTRAEEARTMAYGIESGTVDLSQAKIGDKLITNVVKDEIDGKVTIYSGTTAPSATNPSDKLTDGTTAIGTGDIYIHLDADVTLTSGKVQKKDVSYVATVASNTVSWTQTTATSDLIALGDLADGKRTIFTGATPPTPPTPPTEDNDLWIPSVATTWVSGTTYEANTIVYDVLTKLNYTRNAIASDLTKPPSTDDGWVEYEYVVGELYQRLSDSWVKATRYSEDLGKEVLRIDGLEEANDGLVTTYYGTELEKVAKTGMSYGDWFAIDTAAPVIPTVYRYEGTGGLKVGTLSWVDRTTTSYAKALIQSYNAEYVADGKVNTYYESSEPDIVAEDKGDMWVPISPFSETTDYKLGQVYINDGSKWAPMYAAGNREDYNRFVDMTVEKLTRLYDQLDGSITGQKGTTTERTARLAEINALSPNEIKMLDEDKWFDETDEKVYVLAASTGTATWELDESIDYNDSAKTAYDDGKATVYFGSESDMNAIADDWGVNTKQNNIGDLWKVPYEYSRVDGVLDSGVEIATSVFYPVDNDGEGNTTLHDYKTYRWSGAQWYSVNDKLAFANSEAITKLNVSVNGVDAESGLINTVDILGTKVNTNFEYGSLITLADGNTYTTGFGLRARTDIGGAGTPADPYKSDFWIDANKLAFFDSSSGAYDPITSVGIPIFTASAGEITFNGKVSFNNVTGTENLANTENIPTTYKRASHTLQTIIPETALSLSPLLFILTDSIAGDVYDIEITIETGDGNTIVIEDSTGVDYISFVATDLGEVITTRITLIEPNIYIKRAPYVGSISIIATKVIQEGSTWLNTTTNITNTYIDNAWVENGTPGALTASDLAVAGNYTTINGSQIITGSIDAESINTTNLIVQNVSSGGSNPAFEIRSDALAGDHDIGTNGGVNIYGSSIYGAHIAGSVIEGALVNAGDLVIKADSMPTNTGKISHSITSGSFYGQTYGSGHLDGRVCSDSSQIIVSAAMNYHITNYNGVTDHITGYLSYSIDSGASWVVISSAYAAVDDSTTSQTSQLSFSGIILGSVVPLDGSIMFRTSTAHAAAYTATNSQSYLIATLSNS